MGERERERCRQAPKLRSSVHAPIRALEVGTNVAGRVSRRRGQILHPRINIGSRGCTGRAPRLLPLLLTRTFLLRCSRFGTARVAI